MNDFDHYALRDAFGRFMTGVTVVTTRQSDGTPCGFTANSFTSVSLDPPLLLVCPRKFLSSFDAFTACDTFAVNILAEGQEAVSNTFASFKGDRFAKIAHQKDMHGNPMISGAVVQFSCTTHQIIPAGDHVILLGEVTNFSTADKRGLGYVGGQYFSLGLERAAFETIGGQVVCGAIVAIGDDVLLEPTPQGFRPPQITRQDRGGLRQELKKALAAQGLHPNIGPAYSVFDDANRQPHYSYFLAQCSEMPEPSPLKRVATAELPNLTYTTPALTDMMTRYALEAQSQSFGLYLGDAVQGDVHGLTERT